MCCPNQASLQRTSAFWLYDFFLVKIDRTLLWIFGSEQNFFLVRKGWLKYLVFQKIFWIEWGDETSERCRVRVYFWCYYFVWRFFKLKNKYFFQNCPDSLQIKIEKKYFNKRQQKTCPPKAIYRMFSFFRFSDILDKIHCRRYGFLPLFVLAEVGVISNCFLVIQ